MTMKIIDEQGRVFRKVNLIDALVMTALVCVVPLLAFGYSVMSRPGIDLFPPTPANFGVAVWLPPAAKEASMPEISAGDSLVNAKGETVGKVQEVEEVPFMDRSELEEEFPVAFPRLAICWLRGTARGPMMQFEGVGLRPGSQLSLQTSGGMFSGTVKYIYTTPAQWLTVIVRFETLIPELALVIREGDVQRDVNGKIVSRIKRILKNDFTRTAVMVGASKELVMVSNPASREVILEMEVFSTDQGGQMFFLNGDQQTTLKIGSSFQFRPASYDLSGQIINIQAPPGWPRGMAGGRPPDERRTGVTEQEYEWVRTVIRFDNIAPEVAELVKVDDTETDVNGKPIAVVSGILNIDDAKTLLRMTPDSGLLLLADNPLERQLVAEMRVQCLRVGGVAIFKGQSIKIGSGIQFQTPDYDLQGRVVAIEGHAGASVSGQTWETRWVPVTIKAEGVNLEVANAIREGDIQEDAAGNAVATITDLVKRFSKDRILVATLGRVVTIDRPDLQDLTVTIRLLCTVGAGVPSFRGKTIKLDRVLTFQHMRYDLTGRIVAIHEEPVGAAGLEAAR